MSNREKKKAVKENLRRLLLAEWDRQEARGVSIEDFCQAYGLARKTFYSWRKASGKDLNPRPQRVDPTLKQKAIEIYLRYKGTWGAETISLALRGALSPATVRRAIQPYRDLWRTDRAPKKSSRSDALQPPRAPNLIWSIDWTEYRIHGKKFFILVAFDEAARFFVGWKILEHAPGSADIRSFLKETFERYEGRPVLFKSDRAKVFMSADWEALLRANGVMPYRVSPHSPWEQGIIERAIREVKTWIRVCDPQNTQELAACVDEGMLMLNFLRPRMVLKGRTPAQVFLEKATGREPAEIRHA